MKKCVEDIGFLLICGLLYVVLLIDLLFFKQSLGSPLCSKVEIFLVQPVAIDFQA